MTDQSPLLLLSSGARPRYLEDIVRALALPSGGRIQFRYEQSLLADNVKDLVRKKGLGGHLCYLTYLDNHAQGKTPEIVPVREASIVEVVERGSSFIFRMTARRYIRTKELENVIQLISRNVQDKLPEWKDNYETILPGENPLSGYWVNFLSSELTENQLAPHDPDGETHLNFFEKTVENLCRHTADFGDPSRRLFYNVIGVKDALGKSLPFINGGWQLKPSEEYTLGIYHFFPDEGPLADRPIYWLGSKVTGAALTMLGAETLRADSEYDSKALILQTGNALREVQNSLTIYRTTDPKDSNASTADIVFDVAVEADFLRNAGQAVIIGFTISIPALIAIYPSIISWKGLVIICGGVIAGIASVFKFAKGV